MTYADPDPFAFMQSATATDEAAFENGSALEPDFQQLIVPEIFAFRDDSRSVFVGNQFEVLGPKHHFDFAACGFLQRQDTQLAFRRIASRPARKEIGISQKYRHAMRGRAAV